MSTGSNPKTPAEILIAPLLILFSHARVQDACVGSTLLLRPFLSDNLWLEGMSVQFPVGCCQVIGPGSKDLSTLGIVFMLAVLILDHVAVVVLVSALPTSSACWVPWVS